MPLDPQAQAVIDTVNSLGLPPVWEVTPEQARINAAARPQACRAGGGRRGEPQRLLARTATFPSVSTRRRVAGHSLSWSGITAAAG